MHPISTSDAITILALMFGIPVLFCYAVAGVLTLCLYISHRYGKLKHISKTDMMIYGPPIILVIILITAQLFR